MRTIGKPLFESEEQARKACYEFVEKIVCDDEVIIRKNEVKWYEVTIKTKRVMWYNYNQLTNEALMSVKTDDGKLVIQYYFDWKE